MRRIACCLLLAASGCTPDQPASRAPTPPPDLVLPVAAPIQARERLLHDMEQQKAAARQREADFEAVLQGSGR